MPKEMFHPRSVVREPTVWSFYCSAAATSDAIDAGADCWTAGGSAGTSASPAAAYGEPLLLTMHLFCKMRDALAHHEGVQDGTRFIWLSSS